MWAAGVSYIVSIATIDLLFGRVAARRFVIKCLYIEIIDIINSHFAVIFG
jgi:hypothetical protein